MRIRIRLFTLMWIWIQIVVSKRKPQTLIKSAQIGGLYSINFGLSSANWCGSGPVTDPPYHYDVDPDPDPDFYLIRMLIPMRIQVTKMMRTRIRIHNIGPLCFFPCLVFWRLSLFCQESLEAAAKIQELAKKLAKAKELVRRLPGTWRVFLIPVRSSVSDPYSFYTDPDPAFWAEYQSGSGSRVLMTKNWKNTAGKSLFNFPRPP